MSEDAVRALVTILGYVFVAMFGGLTLLKAYEEFQRGILHKSKLRIWSAFSIVVFLFLGLIFMLLRTQ